jgi:hypothetical protein
MKTAAGGGENRRFFINKAEMAAGKIKANG